MVTMPSFIVASFGALFLILGFCAMAASEKHNGLGERLNNSLRELDGQEGMATEEDRRRALAVFICGVKANCYQSFSNILLICGGLCGAGAILIHTMTGK